MIDPIDWQRALAELERNAAWAAFTEKLAALALAASEAHEDPKLTPEGRAEHLFEMKTLRELGRWHAQETERAKKRVRKEESS